MSRLRSAPVLGGMSMRLLSLVVVVLGALVFHAPAAECDEVKLIMTTISAPNSASNNLIYHEWADRVNARGKGIIQIDIRDGFTLANSSIFYDRLLSDVVQVSYGSLNYVAGKFNLTEVMTLPFLLDSAEQSSVVFWQLYKSGLLDSEFDQIVPLYMLAYPPSALHLVKTPPANFSDLKSLKIIASGQMPTALITRLGGTPLSIPLTDSYAALQRGAADGIYFPLAPLSEFKLDEVTSYHILASLGGGPGGVWMTKAKYLSLPPEARAILDANSGEAESRRVGAVLDQLQAKVQKDLRASKSHTVVELTPAQASLWQADASPMVDAWTNTDDEHRKVIDMVRTLAKRSRSAN
jgi:TRAP-type C4-dicarboxylate transport system substrate-binding protein